MKVLILKIFLILINLNSIISLNGNEKSLITETADYHLSFKNSVLQSFGLILISEIGDNTFILCLVFSNKLPKFILVAVASSAMILMNLFSVLIGYSVPLIFYGSVMDWLAVIIFTILGIILLKDGGNEDNNITLLQRKETLRIDNKLISIEQKEKTTNENDLASPLIPSEFEGNDTNEFNKVEINSKQKKILIWSFFSSLAIAECGSRSQISTIIISSIYNIYGVVIGTSLAYIVCILLAVYLGKIISKFLTERILTYIGGFLFLLFSIQLLIIKLKLI